MLFFKREIVEVCEFYVDDNNEAKTNIIYQKNVDGKITLNNPTKYLISYFGAQGKILKENIFGDLDNDEQTSASQQTQSVTPIASAPAPVTPQINNNDEIEAL